jgi:hypothetical protein
VTPSLTPSEQAVLQAASTIFSSVSQGQQFDDAAAKEARKYALKQAYLLALAVKEMAKEG